MTTLEKLQYIIENSKAGVSLEINNYRNYYDKIEVVAADYVERGDLEQSVADEIIKSGNLVDFHCYKDTPIGFYKIIHHSLEEAINEMYDTYKANL